MIPLPTVEVLDSITIPVPCPVPWEDMHGDHRTRFCDKCSQNVHDVSELTSAEAVQLVTAGEKMPCLRLFRRPDGRVMTADCLTKRERAWKWLHRRSAWAAAVFALVFMGCTKPLDMTPGEPCMGVPPPLPSNTAHVDEHTTRAPTGGAHTARASGTVPATRTEASVRHEATTSGDSRHR
jgi:hypothetical protein